jgi:hypothetical protein
MNAALKRQVRRRAGNCCEYCQIHQELEPSPHHIDHVIARKHHGADDDGNLCLACMNCSLGKGSNVSGTDAPSAKLVRLFHPRTDNWKSHFRWEGAILLGRTAIGRATVDVLNINREDRVLMRRSLIDEDRFPPPIQ